MESYTCLLTILLTMLGWLIAGKYRMGHTIGQKGPIAIRMAKECVNAADEMGLSQGLLFERRNFHALFATQDQKEVSLDQKKKIQFSNFCPMDAGKNLKLRALQNHWFE